MDATLTLWLAVTVINFWLVLLLAVVTVLVLRRQRMSIAQPLFRVAHPAIVNHERETTESHAVMNTHEPIALMIRHEDAPPTERTPTADLRTEASSVIRNRVKKMTNEVSQTI